MSNLFERFTDSARAVVELANLDAKKRSHASIGTEHLLLALMSQDTVGYRFEQCNIDVSLARSELEKRLAIVGQVTPILGSLAMSPSARLAITYSMDISREVDVEHLLMGLCIFGDAKETILVAGADPADIHDELEESLPTLSS